jgi:hypothetical protein
MMRSMVYIFPEVVLEPDEERKISIEPRGWFSARRLFIGAFMREIRGHFKIKRSRLPLLNLDDVITFSEYGRTMIVWLGDEARDGFVREYLPSSVVFIRKRAEDYIMLRNVIVGTRPQMFCESSAVLFGNDGGISSNWDTTSNGTLSLVLHNIGDVQVRVHAAVSGSEW